MKKYINAATQARKVIVAMNHGDDCWIFRATDDQIARAEAIFEYTTVVEGSGLFAVIHNDERVDAFHVASSLDEYKEQLRKQYNNTVKAELEESGYAEGYLFEDYWEFGIDAEDIDVDNPEHFVEAAIDTIEGTYSDKDSSEELDLIDIPSLKHKVHGQDPVIVVHNYEVEDFLKEYEG